MENLKETLKPLAISTPLLRYTVPVSTVPKRDAYIETIDSREAARRYDDHNVSSRPQTTEDNFTATIDSREAAKKYGGAIIR